jgi:hypothetical protein
MFNIPGKNRDEFYKLYEAHRMNTSAKNVYFQNIRLLNTYKTELITRDDFEQYYKGILADIENVSSPVDCLIPNEQKLVNEDSEDPNAEVEVPEGYKMFIINQLVPEYKTIDARIRADKMEDVLPADHAARMAVLDNPDKMSDVIDEIFVNWLVYKYLDTIEKLHMSAYSNYTPVIEWVVKNIDLKTLKDYLASSRINMDKVRSKTHEFIFKPDLSRMKKFYDEEHGDFKTLDVVDIINRLTSNEVVKSDIWIVTALYLTLSFAMSDIYLNKIDESECAKYVRDVLAQI